MFIVMFNVTLKVKSKLSPDFRLYFASLTTNCLNMSGMTSSRPYVKAATIRCELPELIIENDRLTNSRTHRELSGQGEPDKSAPALICSIT